MERAMQLGTNGHPSYSAEGNFQKRAKQAIDRSSRKRRRLERIAHRSGSLPVNGNGKDCEFLYPEDCYRIPRWLPTGSTSRPVLQNEAPDDIVARVENATMVNLPIPDHFTQADLFLAYIPPRRIVAIAYATVRPDIRDNFKEACKQAHVPRRDFYNFLTTSTPAAKFLSSFWTEQITARSGVVMLYAEKFAAMGSPQHAKLLGEMSGRISEKLNKHEHRHITMPDQGETIEGTYESVTPKQLIAGTDAALLEEPEE